VWQLQRPAYLATVGALSDKPRITSNRRLLTQSLFWATAFGSISIIAGSFDNIVLSTARNAGFTPGRVLLVTGYSLIALRACQQCHRSASRFARSLRVFAVAALIQLVRPFSAVLFFSTSGSVALSDGRGIGFVVVNVLVTTVFGLSCIYVALAEEREAVTHTAAQLRDAELRAERAQRMESVGRLATAVAHDYNNFLAIISSGSELARTRLLEGEPPLEELEAIDDAAERLHHMLGLLQRIAGRDVRLTSTLDDAPLLVSLDPTRFEQVI
jgi:signal transduction histidine kinase